MRPGCARLEAEVYPDPRAERVVTNNFSSLRGRFHVKEQGDAFKRFGAQADADDRDFSILQEEQHLIEGFLPTLDFSRPTVPQCLGHAAFKSGKFDESEKWFKSIVDKFPNSDSEPEAQVWWGVSFFSDCTMGGTQVTGEAFKKRYSDLTWAKIPASGRKSTAHRASPPTRTDC